MASQFVREVDAYEKYVEELEDAEAHVAFLENELAFNDHLLQVLGEIQKIHNQLQQAEKLAIESDIMGAMTALAGTC